ncbi:MAG TPA: dethiobiotin synthetase [Micromonosporaceae bacterium]
MAYQVAVCGPADCTEAERSDAYRVGQLLADAGAVVVCGCGGGVMAAVAAGVRSRGGIAVGVCRDDERDQASPDLSATLYPGVGEARNAFIVASVDAVIVVGGSWGSLSEQALALRRGDIPVVSLRGWEVIDIDGRRVPGAIVARHPGDAVALALPSSG